MIVELQAACLQLFEFQELQAAIAVGVSFVRSNSVCARILESFRARKNGPDVNPRRNLTV